MPFEGTFDGAGYHISNLYIHTSGMRATGLLPLPRVAMSLSGIWDWRTVILHPVAVVMILRMLAVLWEAVVSP